MSSNHYQYQNSQYSRVMNLKYKTKYKKLKRQIKQLVFVSDHSYLAKLLFSYKMYACSHLRKMVHCATRLPKFN